MCGEAWRRRDSRSKTRSKLHQRRAKGCATLRQRWFIIVDALSIHCRCTVVALAWRRLKMPGAWDSSRSDFQRVVWPVALLWGCWAARGDPVAWPPPRSSGVTISGGGGGPFGAHTSTVHLIRTVLVWAVDGRPSDPEGVLRPRMPNLIGDCNAQGRGVGVLARPWTLERAGEQFGSPLS